MKPSGSNISLSSLDDIFGTEVSLFPSEADQIKSIGKAASVQKAPAASFSHADIEALLRLGTGTAGGKLRVYDMYQRGETPKAMQGFLKKEHGSYHGHSYTFLDGSSGFVDYSLGQGMKLRRDGTDEQMVLRWTVVEKHMRALIASDRYLTAEEKQEYEARQEPVWKNSLAMGVRMTW